MSHGTPVTPGVVKAIAGGGRLLGDIEAQIGGPHVQVTSLLSGLGTDPHLYVSDVASALAVAQARLVIASGAGYDDFISQLFGATVNAGRVALSVQAALGAYGPDANPALLVRHPPGAAGGGGHRGRAGPARPG